MNACTTLRRGLAAFVAGELDAARETAVAAHLRDCGTCRREAAALQQARRALRAAAQAVPRGVDEAMFADLHRTIVQAVQREPAPRAVLVRRFTQGLAAAALFACGFWLVGGERDTPLLQRPPLRVPAGQPATAVPWSGGRVELRPLGDETGGAAAAPAGADVGPGLMGRWRLRTLEDPDFVAPILPLPGLPAESPTGSPAEIDPIPSPQRPPR